MPVLDQKLYTMEALIRYARSRINQDVESSSALTPMDSSFRRAMTSNGYLATSHSGDPGDRLYVKHFIRKVLTEQNGGKDRNYPDDYQVNHANINTFIDWDHPDAVDAYILFIALLYVYRPQYGDNAFGHLVEKYHFNDLRDRGTEGPGCYIDEADIRRVWKEEPINMDFETKLEVLLQLVYEENWGNSCIDELLYQNISDISAGVSGIPSDVNVTALENGYPAYRTCWVRYKGCAIHLMFTNFGSYERLKEVAKNTVDFEMRGQFSEKEGFKLGYGKDGSRRTAAIDPFGECAALWVRKFTEVAATNEDLYGGIPGSEMVMAIERALVRGGATIPICGPQGSGKTTKLEALAQYIQNFYAIRVIESEFEARLRWKYPNKNIYTVEANDLTPVTPSQAYNFSLRSAGDIYIIGEARSDDMIINVTRTANRGGRSVLFTFHPKSAAMTIPEIANAMIREKMYTNLKDAVATALNTVQVCIFVSVDIETHKHYYEIYEFVPNTNTIPKSFMDAMEKETRTKEFMKSVYAYMQTMASADTYYTTVPIIVYDREGGKYRMVNTISDGLYRELMDKTPLEEERMELARVFRPDEFLTMLAKHKHESCSEAFRQRAIEAYHLHTEFMAPSQAAPTPEEFQSPTAGKQDW